MTDRLDARLTTHQPILVIEVELDALVAQYRADAGKGILHSNDCSLTTVAKADRVATMLLKEADPWKGRGVSRRRTWLTPYQLRERVKVERPASPEYMRILEEEGRIRDTYFKPGNQTLPEITPGTGEPHHSRNIEGGCEVVGDGNGGDGSRCGREIEHGGRRMCGMHNRRWRRHGDPLVVMVSVKGGRPGEKERDGSRCLQLTPLPT